MVHAKYTVCMYIIYVYYTVYGQRNSFWQEPVSEICRSGPDDPRLLGKRIIDGRLMTKLLYKHAKLEDEGRKAAKNPKPKAPEREPGWAMQWAINRYKGKGEASKTKDRLKRFIVTSKNSKSSMLRCGVPNRGNQDQLVVNPRKNENRRIHWCAFPCQ